MVDAGEKFSTVFPENMKLSGNIELVAGQRTPRTSRKPKDVLLDTETGDEGTGDTNAGDEGTGGDEASGD